MKLPCCKSVTDSSRSSSASTRGLPHSASCPAEMLQVVDCGFRCPHLVSVALFPLGAKRPTCVHRPLARNLGRQHFLRLPCLRVDGIEIVRLLCGVWALIFDRKQPECRRAPGASCAVS